MSCFLCEFCLIFCAVSRCDPKRSLTARFCHRVTRFPPFILTAPTSAFQDLVTPTLTPTTTVGSLDSSFSEFVYSDSSTLVFRQTNPFWQFPPRSSLVTLGVRKTEGGNQHHRSKRAARKRNWLCGSFCLLMYLVEGTDYCCTTTFWRICVYMACWDRSGALKRKFFFCFFCSTCTDIFALFEDWIWRCGWVVNKVC